MNILKQHWFIFAIICLVVMLVIVFGLFLYNNCFYAQRVLKAIENEDIVQLEKLMKQPLGNLNCKPTLWIIEVLSETMEPTPLQAACNLGNPKIVAMLLENGADVNYTHWDKSRDLGSPLINAAGSLSNERLQVIKLLIDYGANVNYESVTGNDVLSCAVYASKWHNDTIDVIEYLEQEGINIYKKYSETDNTLLHKACECDSLRVIQYLIEQRGFDVNAVNADGDTPLIYFLRFASKREKDTLLYLVQAGADLTIQNNEGKTAYDYAVERHPEFIGDDGTFGGQGHTPAS